MCYDLCNSNVHERDYKQYIDRVCTLCTLHMVHYRQACFVCEIITYYMYLMYDRIIMSQFSKASSGKRLVQNY